MQSIKFYVAAETAAKRLKNGKANGPDNTPNELLLKYMVGVRCVSITPKSSTPALKRTCSLTLSENVSSPPSKAWQDSW